MMNYNVPSSLCEFFKNLVVLMDYCRLGGIVLNEFLEKFNANPNVKSKLTGV